MNKSILILLNLSGLFILSFLIPKKKGLYIFGDGHKKFKDNSKYLFLHCLEKEVKTLYFILDKKTISGEGEKFSKYFIQYDTLRAFWLNLRAEYIFVIGMTGDVSISHFLGRFKVVNLWHGGAIKKIMFDDKKSFIANPNGLVQRLQSLFSVLECKMLYRIITSNSDNFENYKSAFKSKNVVLTGLPRNDVFFQKDILIKKKALLKKLNFEDFDKLFLYAPTFRDNTSFKPFSENFLINLNNYLVNNNSIFLIKKHPVSDDFVDVNKYSNIVDVSEYSLDIQELSIISDCLVSDYSGIYFDFVLQNKPIISYMFDIDDYLLNNRSTYSNILDIFPPSFVFSEDELLNMISKIFNLHLETSYVEKYQNFVKYYNFYSDGNSSCRVLDSLIK
jgi:CDP-glycerol glycerophosphotransferase